ncbi:hypothetical protein ACFYTS_21965 [Nocardia sp. NPDC004151]|uniref:hypothetical protein n=1 Tax=Nocardia sp. NPDC004151 TaxID=3364304 RepID=UPI0036AB911C
MEITNSGLDRVDLSHRSYAMAAVKFSASFLESLVNDLFSDAADPDVSTHGRMTRFSAKEISDMATIWNDTEVKKTSRQLRLTDKYQESLAIAGAPRFVGNDAVYRGFNELTYLRNALVHFKVGWQLAGAKQNQASSIEKLLKPKFAENKQKIGQPWFPNKCLGAGCARWACDSATAFADEWLTRMSLPLDYRHVLSDLGAP